LKHWLVYFGMAMTIIFGGGFLIRLIRDGEFYIAEFTGGVLGIILISAALFVKKQLQIKDT
jgi:hypothetical protein